MNENCTRCNGLMIPERLTDFYMEVEVLKCVCCGRYKEVAIKNYDFRKEEVHA